MSHSRTRQLWTAATLSVSLLAIVAGPALGHERRDVASATFVVGMIDEPVFVGDRSGLELRVVRGDAPVDGLEQSLKAEVTAQGQSRQLPLEPAFGEPGSYRSYFIPSAAGQYSFHITGTLDGTPVDERFTSGPETFGDVEDTASGAFPVPLEAPADVAANARKGADAAGQVAIAMGLGGAGLIAGLAALGLALARRRPAGRDAG
jgi:hypothetical protein